jgi:hypothetical protein
MPRRPYFTESEKIKIKEILSRPNAPTKFGTLEDIRAICEEMGFKVCEPYRQRLRNEASSLRKERLEASATPPPVVS